MNLVERSRSEPQVMEGRSTNAETNAKGPSNHATAFNEKSCMQMGAIHRYEIARTLPPLEAPYPGRCTTLGTQIMNLRRFLIGSYLEIPSRQLITMAMIRNLLVNLREADCRALASTGSRWARMKRLTGR
jgi:hypothetical protein